MNRPPIERVLRVASGPVLIEFATPFLTPITDPRDHIPRQMTRGRSNPTDPFPPSSWHARNEREKKRKKKGEQEEREEDVRDDKSAACTYNYVE